MSALPIGPVTFVLAQKYESLTHETTIGIVLSLVVSVFTFTLSILFYLYF